MYGHMIQKLRKQHKLSQKELGDSLGIGVSSISMWESEKRAPDHSYLMVLAELFNVSVDYILYGKSDEVVLSPLENEVLALFRDLPADQQHEIKGIMKGFIVRGGRQ